MSLNNLGNLYVDQGKPTEAEAIYKRASSGYEKALGGEHTFTLSFVNNLSNLYRAQDKLAEAEAMYKRALAGYEEALGAEHTSTLDTTNNLGFLYLDQIRLAEAEEMYKRALIGYEKAFGAVHMHTLRAVNILAHVCRNRHYLHVTSMNRSKVQPSLCVYKGDTAFKFFIPVYRLWIERRQHPSSTSSFALPSEDSTRTSLTSGDSRIQSNVADYSPNNPSFLEYYQDIDWQRIKGRWGPAPGGRGKGTSPIWAHGWRIAEHDTNKVHWLCRRCYQKRIPTKP
ncbi:hypothetical protein KCU95_g19837, partial [Aureobasidium melanogenum]